MPTSPIREAFLTAADRAARLLADAAVDAHWVELSALEEFRVAGLAGHLAAQIRYVRDFLAAPAPEGTTSSLDEHYARADWIGAALDDEANVSTRDNGEDAAADGPTVLATETSVRVRELAELLPAEPADRRVRLAWADRLLSLDDFLLTRMMEIVVHSDDLAVSVGVPTPAFPPSVTEPVIGLLASISVQRHGPLPLLRALSRRERAPESVAAF